MSLERLYYNDPFSNIVISCDVSVALDADALVKKLHDAVVSVPAFAQSIALDADDRLMYRTIGFERNLNNIAATDEEDTAIVCRLMAHPFALQNGESLQILYKAMSFGYRLYFCMHHIIGDANSLLLLMRQALTEDACILETKCAENAADLDTRAQYLVRTINQKYPHEPYTRQAYLCMHRNIFAQTQLEIRKVVLQKAELQELKQLCRQQGVSLSAYFVSELLRRQSVELVCLPVDTRRTDDLFGNFVGRIDIARMAVQKKADTAEAIHRLIRQALQADQESAEQLLSRLHPQFYDDVIFDVYGGHANPTARKMAKLIGYKDARPTTFVSNLKEARLQNEQISNLCFYPPHPMERYATIGIVTHRDQMVITVQKFRKETCNA